MTMAPSGKVKTFNVKIGNEKLGLSHKKNVILLSIRKGAKISENKNSKLSNFYLRIRKFQILRIQNF